MRVFVETLIDNVEKRSNKVLNNVALIMPSSITKDRTLALLDVFSSGKLKICASINCSMAAIYAYGLQNCNNKAILVLDFGANALEITSIKLNKSMETLNLEACLFDFGGNHLDEILKRYLKQMFEENGITLPFHDNDRLEEAYKNIKIGLKDNVETEVVLKINGTLYSIKITRDYLEVLYNDNLNRLDTVLEIILAHNTNLTDVIVMGGVSNWWFTENLLNNYIDGYQLHAHLSSFTTAAVGALLKGKEILETQSRQSKNIVASQTEFILNKSNETEVVVSAEDQITYEDGTKMIQSRLTTDEENNEAIATFDLNHKKKIKEKCTNEECTNFIKKLRKKCSKSEKKAIKLWKQNKIDLLDKDMIVEKCKDILVWLNNCHQPTLKSVKYKYEELDTYTMFIINLN